MLFFSLLAPFLWAITNHLDKIFIDKFVKDKNILVTTPFMCSISIFSLPILYIIDSSIFEFKLLEIFLVILGGTLYPLSILPYMLALKKTDASIIVPMFQLSTVFIYILGKIFFNESLDLIQILAFVLIFIGTIGISLDLTQRVPRIKTEVLIMMTISSLMLAFNSLIFKLISENNSFVTVSFWQNFGYFLVFLGFLVFGKNIREAFISIIRNYKTRAISINFANQSINLGAIFSYNYALTIAPMALVNIVLGIQPVFVLMLGILFTIFFPTITKEDISTKILGQKIFFILLMVLAIVLSQV